MRAPKDCLAGISKKSSGDGESDGSEDLDGFRRNQAWYDGSRDCSEGGQLYPDIPLERNLLGPPSEE